MVQRCDVNKVLDRKRRRRQQQDGATQGGAAVRERERGWRSSYRDGAEAEAEASPR